MTLKINPPLLKEFHLEETDKLYGDDATKTLVTFRQATRGDEEARNRLFAIVEKQYKKDSDNEDVVSYMSDISMDDVYRREVFRTLVASNIMESDEKELFLFKNGSLNMSENEFTKAWGKLPWEAAQEMIKCNHEVNVQWAPSGND